jgi:putative protease
MCGSISAEVSGDLTQRANNKPLTEETALKALKKTGGTPFYLDSLSFSGTQAFLPAASLNALRRDALSTLSGALIAARERAIPKREPFLLPDPASFLGAPRVLVRTEILSEIPALLAGGAECVLYSPPDYREPYLSDALKTLPKDCVLCLPPVCEGKTLDMIIACAKKAGVRMCLGSVGQLGANIETPFLCDFGVPVTNNQSERFLAARGACGITLSPELSLENLRALPAPKAERILTVYGRARLMVLTHCPERVMRGLETGHECCALCEQGAGARGQTLTDRRGFVYPLSPFRLPEGCRVRVLNALPTHLLARAEALRALRVSILLDFSTESTEERLALLSVYRRALVGLPFDAPKVRGTQGRLADGAL